MTVKKYENSLKSKKVVYILQKHGKILILNYLNSKKIFKKIKKRNSRLTIASNLWKFQPNLSKKVAKDINGLNRIVSGYCLFKILWRQHAWCHSFAINQTAHYFIVGLLVNFFWGGVERWRRWRGGGGRGGGYQMH